MASNVSRGEATLAQLLEVQVAQDAPPDRGWVDVEHLQVARGSTFSLRLWTQTHMFSVTRMALCGCDAA